MKRDKILDFCKGIGIILVMFGHIISIDTVTKLIYAFHMPLFFLISGYSLYYSLSKNPDFKTFLLKRVKTILIPYFAFSFLCYLYWFFIERNIRGQYDIDVFSSLLNIFFCRIDMNLYSYNIVMWFLPCLFISNIIVYFISKFNYIKAIILSSILLISGYYLSKNNIVLPFTIETSLVTSFFVYLGYFFKKNYASIGCKLQKNILSIFALLVFILSFLCNSKVDILNHKYGNVLFFLTGSLSGASVIYLFTYFVINLIKRSKFIDLFTKLIIFLGVNSLSFMVLHEPIKRIVLKLFSVIIKTDVTLLRESFFYSCLILIMLIIVIIPINFILEKYVPYLIGKRKEVK